LPEVNLSAGEAQLFRQLMDVFGADRVLPHLPVSMICGQEYPESLQSAFPELADWARTSICLFTVIDGESSPKLVLDIFEGFEASIEIDQVERQRYLPDLFAALNVHYITLSPAELESCSTSGNKEKLCAILEQKIQQGKSS